MDIVSRTSTLEALGISLVTRPCIDMESIDIVDAYLTGLKIAKRVLETGAIKITFTSPTLLRDPLRIAGKYKSYTPIPFIVFATPVYTLLHSKGMYTVRGLRTNLLMLHRLFNETYSMLGGVKIKWIYYNKRPEPTLIGYVNYRINEEYLEHLRSRLSVEEWLGEIFAYMLALDVGAGRAAGFGHVELIPVHKQESITRDSQNNTQV